MGATLPLSGIPQGRARSPQPELIREQALQHGAQIRRRPEIASFIKLGVRQSPGFPLI
jgi:hypothetical protein